MVTAVASVAGEVFEDRANRIEAELRGLEGQRSPGHVSPRCRATFFVADIPDISAKSDLPTLEHPIFALRAGERRVRTYHRAGVTLTVKPGADGCATIHDKDLWIYCISQLTEALNRGRTDVGRCVRFTAHDFLRVTRRGTDGRAYDRLVAALARLAGTRLQTDIQTGGVRERAGFGLVDAWRVIERETDGRMMAVEVTLPEWLWRAVQARQVLTLSRGYFGLRRPLDRRIYELARKHCGRQPTWRVRVSTLHEKTGSRATLAEFRRLLAGLHPLPEYDVTVEGDMVAVFRREMPCG